MHWPSSPPLPRETLPPPGQGGFGGREPGGGSGRRSTVQSGVVAPTALQQTEPEQQPIKAPEMEGWVVKANLIVHCPGFTNCPGEQERVRIKGGQRKLTFSPKGDFQETSLSIDWFSIFVMDSFFWL